jgi:hypothetical protein
MDKYFLWQQLSSEQKMNVMCDKLVKHAVSKAIRSGMGREEKQMLPSEDTAVFVNNRKLTRYLENEVCCEVGREKACKCLTSQEGWTNENFIKVNWDRLHKTEEKSGRLQNLACKATRVCFVE